MPRDPAYVQRLLTRAREEGQWYCGQPDAAAYCFEMMAFIDPNAPSDEEMIRSLREEARGRGAPEPHWAPTLSPELADLVASALPAPFERPTPALVDWRFLDADDGQPGELPEWAKKMMRLFPGAPAEYIAQHHRWSRPIKPPATLPRRDPNEPPFDPGEFFGPDLEGGVPTEA